MNVFRREKVSERKVGVNVGFYTFYQPRLQKCTEKIFIANGISRTAASKWSQEREAVLYGSSQAIPGIPEVRVLACNFAPNKVVCTAVRKIADQRG